MEHQVDHRAATANGGNASLLYDLGVTGPVGLVRMTVDPGRARPGVVSLEHQTALDRQVRQIGQLAVFLGVAGDQEDGPCHPAQAARWSLMPGAPHACGRVRVRPEEGRHFSQPVVPHVWVRGRDPAE